MARPACAVCCKEVAASHRHDDHHELLARHHERLSGFPAPLEQHFEAGLRALSPRLIAVAAPDLGRNRRRTDRAQPPFLGGGRRVLQGRRGHAPRTATWEAIETLGREALQMAGESAPLAVAFLRAAPATIAAVGPNHLRQWADLGRRLYKGNWKSSSLAAQFFDLRRRPSSRCCASGRRAASSSSSTSSPATATNSPPPASRIAPDVLAQARRRRPAAVHRLRRRTGADQLGRFAPLLRARRAPPPEGPRAGARTLPAARRAGRPRPQPLGVPVLRRGGQRARRARTGRPRQGRRARRTARAVFALRRHGLRHQHAHGAPAHPHRRTRTLARRRPAKILQASHDGGEAYFRLQSTRGEDILENLSARVELSRVGEILRLYCKALTGRNVSIQTTDVARGEGHRLGRRAPRQHRRQHDLPARASWSASTTKDENFAAHEGLRHPPGRAHRIRQLRLRARPPGRRLPAPAPAPRRDREGRYRRRTWSVLRPLPRAPAGQRPLHHHRRLAHRCATSSASTAASASRSSACSATNSSSRPDVRELPLRNAFVENLVRASLDGADAVLWPKDRAEVMARALGAARTRFMRRRRPSRTPPRPRCASTRSPSPSRTSRRRGRERMGLGRADGGRPGHAHAGRRRPGRRRATRCRLAMSTRARAKRTTRAPRRSTSAATSSPNWSQLLMKLREDAQSGEAGQMSPGSR